MQTTLIASMTLPTRSPAISEVRVLISGTYVQSIYLRDERRPLIIGRSPTCDVHIDNERISRRHCELRPGVRGQWLIQDHASSNGTHISHQGEYGPFHRISWEVLTVGCRVQFGPVTFLPVDERGDAPITARRPSEFIRTHAQLSNQTATTSQQIARWQNQKPAP